MNLSRFRQMVLTGTLFKDSAPLSLNPLVSSSSLSRQNQKTNLSQLVILNDVYEKNNLLSLFSALKLDDLVQID
jgi:hypothetical protein